MVELRILEIKLEFLRFLMVELRYLGVDWDCLKISYDFKENLKIDFHQGCQISYGLAENNYNNSVEG